MKFLGYRRPDGKVGVRNKIFILPTSVCASDTTRIIASQIESAVTFNNQNGCSQVAGDQQLTMDVMAGMAANPNVYGIIAISLGCENCQMDLVVEAIRERTNKPIESFIIQENGGTIATIEKAVRAGRKMAQEASKLQREEFDISNLIIGTECGGSDPTSGLASNVLIGELSDNLVNLGSTSILSETTEFIGAEHILAKRAKNEEVDLPKILLKDIKTMRVAIDDYYKATGTFPDLVLANSDEKLESIYYEKDGEKIYFKDYLRESSLPKTPTFKDLTESNKVYLVENFKKVTNDGGWNYNIKTGEIHANLPYNFFEQGIDWENY